MDSLVRLLLGVEVIQPRVANILLEKLPEYMDDPGNVKYLHTILFQMVLHT